MTRLIFWISALALLLGFAARLPAQRGAAAQLVNVKGRVEIRRAGRQPLKGTLLLPLEQGDVVTLRKGGAAEVLFGNGARFALWAGSSALVGPAELTRRSGRAPRALKRLPIPPSPAQRFNPRMLGPVRRGAGGDPNAPAKGAPYGALRDFPVTLRWTAGAEGKDLEVRIRDENRKAVYETTLPASSREFNVPQEVLQRGKLYIWTVTPAGGGSPGSIGWLRVLLPQEKTALEFLERETAEERRSNLDNPAAILLLAQTYERFGMTDDALSAYQSAAQMRPNDTGLQDTMKRLSEGG